MKRIITTPIYYVTDEPHIGHFSTTISADVLKRYYKSLGDEVFLLVGTDEHGKKIEQSAQKNNMKNKEFVDLISQKYVHAWKELNIDYDRFIRTTDKDHIEEVNKSFKIFKDNEDLYLSKYEGLYCVDCEQYYDEKELIENKCPIHEKDCLKMEEESYFFRLSKYENFLKELYKNNFITPKGYSNEIESRVIEGLRDVSVSRTTFDWGIKLDFDKKHIVYVWYDALLNYITPKKDDYEMINIIGKDILWFHAVYFPAMLKSLNKKIPKLYVHGWFNLNGKKISKSKGNKIGLEEITKYGIDISRYTIIRQMPYSSDSEYNDVIFKDRYDEYLNNISNLIYRVSKLSEKYDFTEGNLDKNLILEIEEKFNNIKKDINEFKLQIYSTKIVEFAKYLNKYMNDNEPWKISKTDEKKAKEILYNLTFGIEFLNLIIEPITPNYSKITKEIFNFKNNTLNEFFKNTTKKYNKPNPKMLLEKGE